MSKETYTVDPHIGHSHEKEVLSHNRKDPRHPVDPLSGSKKVKNRQHSRENHGEGS